MSLDTERANISAEQLMHFVDKQDYLIDILNHNFYPRLSCEDVLDPIFPDQNVYIAMKCFCDIPIDRIEKHMKIYGEYGVGFKKKWGINAGITPVVYYNQNSPYVNYMRRIYNQRINYYNENHYKEDLIESSAVVDALVLLRLSFTMYKPVYGKNSRTGDEEYCFYNEREWRYIISPDSPHPAFLPIKKALDGDKITHFKDIYIENYRADEQIEFSYDDIEFVIIPSIGDMDQILEKLTVSVTDKEKLKTKMKTLDMLLCQPDS